MPGEGDQVAAAQLRKTIADGEQQLAQYRMELTDDHPRVQALNDRIDQAKAALSNLPAEAPAQLVVTEQPVVTEKPALERPKSPIVQFIVGREAPHRTIKIDSKVKERVYTPQESLPPPPIPAAKAITVGEARIVPTVTSDTHILPTIAIIVCLLLSIALMSIIVIKRRSNRVNDPDQVLKVLPLPILGWINQTPIARRTGEILPGIHRLRSNLRHQAGSTTQEIIVTSPNQGDGKTILAGALALNLAESGTSVTLVDANPMNPSLAAMFCCKEGSGWVEANVKHNLRVITCGGTLDSSEFKNLRNRLRETSEVIIYDGSALTEDLGSLLLADKDSRVIVVARMKHTNLESIAYTASYLRQYRINKAALAFFAAPEHEMIRAQYQTHLQLMH